MVQLKKQKSQFHYKKNRIGFWHIIFFYCKLNRKIQDINNMKQL